MRYMLILFALLLFPQDSVAQAGTSTADTYEIYYLAVGNGHYAKNARQKGFEEVEGARKSANEVAACLARAGAKAGIVLTSEADKLITRMDVMNALQSLLATVKQAQARNPLVIFYFCGHGVSEGVGWNHFSIPGTFIPPEDFSTITINTLNGKAIYAGDISDEIEKQKYACLLLLDACYEGKEAELLDTVFSRQLANNFKDIFNVVRALNEFRGPAMAVFSARPGTLAQTVQNPLDPDSTFSIGPLARRLLLSFDQVLKERKNLTIERFLQQMADPNYDRPTATVLTKSEPEHPKTQLINYVGAEKGKSETRKGTGSLPRTTPHK